MKQYAPGVLLLLVTLCSCKNKEKEKELQDCSQLRTGVYEYRSPLMNGKISIERNDSIQTESESTTGISINFRIAWVSPCEYTLKFHSFANEKTPGKIQPDAESISRSKVTKITPNYYIAETIVMGESGVQRDTILIIR